MPTAKNILEKLDKEEERRATEEAEAAVKAGRVVPHQEVIKWLRSWGKPNELPCPKPK